MAARSSCVSLARGLFGLRSLPTQISGNQRYFRRCVVTATESKSEAGKDSSKEPPVAETAAEDGGNSELQKKVEDLEKMLAEQSEKLKLDIKDIDDKYKRSLAETENVRTRMRKQVDDAKLFGIQGFCKDLLEVADVLNKATESVPKEELTSKNPYLKSLYEGLAMTETQLHKVFTRHGLVQIDPPEGEKFDPNFHEALFQQPAPGKQSGTVAVVTKVGYKLHDRTIRPALVGVFK